MRIHATWLLAACLAVPAEARFLQSDAAMIDREERLDRSTYIDGSAYRFTPRGDQLWRSKDLGYRISDGSYDADRSRLNEQIKLTTPTGETLAFSYKRDRYHDLADELVDDELRLAVRHAGTGLFAAVLADGNTSYKQWGDLGAAVGWRGGRRLYGEVYAWSVDHFYNSKQEVDLGTYEPHPETFGARLVADVDADTGIELGYERDEPFTWERSFRDPADDYAYQYAASAVTGKARWAVSRGVQLLVEGRGDFKREHKEWSMYSKGLVRRGLRVDASTLLTQADDTTDQIGAVRVLRKADYSYDASRLKDGDTVEEEASPDASRRESIVYWSRSLPLGTSDGGGRYYFQVGLSQGWADLGSAGRGVDQKLQFAFELFWRENAGTFLTSSFDVDGIRADWPYDRRPTPGNIWDGGGVQFMATF